MMPKLQQVSESPKDLLRHAWAHLRDWVIRSGSKALESAFQLFTTCYICCCSRTFSQWHWTDVSVLWKYGASWCAGLLPLAHLTNSLDHALCKTHE